MPIHRPIILFFIEATQQKKMKTCLKHIFLMIVLINLNLNQFVKAGIHQKKLLEKLFKNYDPSERPVANDNDSVDVEVGLSIQQIVDVDEKKQTIIFSGWLDLTWKDYTLKWNPEEFGNITKIRISSSKVWLPDLLLYNSADDSFDPKTNVNAVLMYTGDVQYIPPGMFRSTCEIEIYQFPFDEQYCSLKFGSWSYDDLAVNLLNKSHTAQLDSYIENGEWFLQNVESYSKSIKYECCSERFPFVMFTLHLRRRTLYFIFNLVFPCVLISFMSFLGFSLPPDSGEKIGLEITTLLSIIMFSQLITGIIPESSLSVPKIALYFASVMVISTLSIIANVIVLIFHHKNVKIQKPMPKWVETWICIYLARLLRMEKPNKSSKKSKKSKENMSPNQTSSCNDLNELSSKSLLANVLDINDDFGVIGNKLNYYNNNNKNININNRFKSKTLNEQLAAAAAASAVAANNNNTNNINTSLVNYQSSNQTYLLKRDNSSLSQSNCENCGESLICSTTTNTNSKSEANLLRKHLHLILRELRYLTQKVKGDEEDEDKALNWKFAAMVIDRLCMIFFAASTVLSTVLILLTSKNFFKLN